MHSYVKRAGTVVFAIGLPPSVTHCRLGRHRNFAVLILPRFTLWVGGCHRLLAATWFSVSFQHLPNFGKRSLKKQYCQGHLKYPLICAHWALHLKHKGEKDSHEIGLSPFIFIWHMFIGTMGATKQLKLASVILGRA